MDWRESGWTGEDIRMTIILGVYLEWVAGSRWSGELIERLYKKIDRCVNLEWVAGSRLTAKAI